MPKNEFDHELCLQRGTAPRRRFLRFSLRALLLLVVVIAVPLGWMLDKIRQQGQVVAALEKMGCNLGFEDSTLGFFGWTGTLVSNDGIRNVIFFDALNASVTDSDLVLLSGLPRLRYVYVASTQVSDVGLANIQGLPEITELSLARTQISDQGLARLQGLDQLQWLQLDGTQVTDAGLAHLRGMKQLRTLSLLETQVTDDGVQKLQAALPACAIRHRIARGS